MDAGNSEKIRWRSRARSRAPTIYTPPLRSSRNNSNGDRFIPNRSAMDFGFAHYVLTEPRKEEENTSSVPASPSKEKVYTRLLSELLFNKRTRILAFQNKPPAPTDRFLSSSDTVYSRLSKLKKRRYIPQSADKAISAPGLVEDYYLNLLDWGSRDVLSIALENTVCLWNHSAWSASEVLEVNEDIGPVTSVSWAPDGQHLAVGLNNSDIQLWDSSNNHLVRTLRGVHQSRVGSLAWNNNSILTTGGMDGKIANNDVRIRSSAVQTYRGHTQEVCGLKWSGSGQQLASGGNDNLLHIWDLSMVSSTPPLNQHQWVHRFEDHMGAVKALAWCPFQSNMLASGGVNSDRCIKFWNTQTGTCLNSVNTGSQVFSLLWNKNERELLSSNGSVQNQLTLWKYPSMVKMAELAGHSSRILFMAQSPNGCTVASAAGDETLMFWNIFGNPDVAKPTAKASAGPFSSYYHLR